MPPPDIGQVVVIAGGTGFLGSSLADALAADGHRPVILSRDPSRARRGAASRMVAWSPDGEAAAPWAEEIDGAHAVINLAGESLASRRWTTGQKQRIRSSRVLATRSLVQAVRRATQPPGLLISASAAGYYGPLDDRVVTEEEPPGTDFLARLCVEWEAEAMRASSAPTRVVCIRSGLVLERGGGALRSMLPPFWFGVGGPLGPGRQYWPWIHREDWIGLVRFAIATPSLSGPLNASAPHPVTNREFVRTLGRVLRRPALMPAPAFALRLLLGEMADALLLSGQRMMPDKATRLGYAFAYARLDEALEAVLGRARPLR